MAFGRLGSLGRGFGKLGGNLQGAGGPSDAVTIGQNTLYTKGPYYAFLSTFNTSGITHAESMTLHSTTFPNNSDLTWNYQTGTTSIKSFLHVVGYGDYYGTTVQTPIPAAQVKTLSVLTLTHNLTWSGDANGYDVIYDMFLTSVANGHATGQHKFEIAIVLRAPAYFQSYFNSMTTIGTTTISGISWDVKVDASANGGATPYIVFMPTNRADVLAATIDAKAMFTYLIAQGTITGNEYYNGHALGAEIAQGAGTLHVTSGSVVYNPVATVTLQRTQAMTAGNTPAEMAYTRSGVAWAENLAGVFSSFAANVRPQTDKGTLYERPAKNLVANNSGTGTTAGTATIPTGWGISLPAGLAYSTVSLGTGANGLPELVGRISGTTTASNTISLRVIPSAQAVVAGEIYLPSLFYRNVAGTPPTGWALYCSAGANNSTQALALYKTVTDRYWPAPVTVPSGTTTIGLNLISASIGSGTAVDFTFAISGLQLEAITNATLSPSRPIIATGTQLTRGAPVETFSGSLLGWLTGTAGCLQMNVNGMAFAASVQPLLGHNAGTRALARAANGGVTTSQGGGASTRMAWRSNWTIGNFARFNWQAGQAQVVSELGDMATGSGTVAAISSVQWMNDGTLYADGFVSSFKIWDGFVTDQSDVLAFNTDLAIYGATFGSIATALEFNKNNGAGKKTMVFGDWRERHLGGMPTGGLGITDAIATYSPQPYGGWNQAIFDRYDEYLGKTKGLASSWNVEGKDLEFVFDEYLRRAGIKVMWTTGVTTVNKTGTRITSIQTADGKTITAPAWHEGGYDGNIITRCGMSYTYGREAANTDNTLNGYTAGVALNVKGFATPIDAYVTPGNSASGVINFVDAGPYPSQGAADTRMQAYNYRLWMTTTAGVKASLPSTAPTGYNVADYEILLRQLASLTAQGKVYGTDYVFDDLILYGVVTSVPSCLDINASNAMSIDFIGGSQAYPPATYAQKEAIVKATQRYILGFFYTCQYGTDSRIPAGLKTRALAFGWNNLNGTEPHENDVSDWMNGSYCMYVREAIRPISDLVWYGSDLTAVDGTTPRSSKLIGAGRYVRDSHITSYKVSGGVVQMEGGLSGGTGGADLVFPLPFEIMVPKKAEITNLTFSFCTSTTHESFSAFRMESSTAVMGHAAGAAHCLGPAVNPAVNIQDVDYTTLRANLVAGNAYIPTVN